MGRRWKIALGVAAVVAAGLGYVVWEASVQLGFLFDLFWLTVAASSMSGPAAQGEYRYPPMEIDPSFKTAEVRHWPIQYRPQWLDAHRVVFVAAKHPTTDMERNQPDWEIFWWDVRKPTAELYFTEADRASGLWQAWKDGARSFSLSPIIPCAAFGIMQYSAKDAFIVAKPEPGVWYRLRGPAGQERNQPVGFRPVEGFSYSIRPDCTEVSITPDIVPEGHNANALLAEHGWLDFGNPDEVRTRSRGPQAVMVQLIRPDGKRLSLGIPARHVFFFDFFYYPFMGAYWIPGSFGSIESLSKKDKTWCFPGWWAWPDSRVLKVCIPGDGAWGEATANSIRPARDGFVMRVWVDSNVPEPAYSGLYFYRHSYRPVPPTGQPKAVKIAGGYVNQYFAVSPDGCRVAYLWAPRSTGGGAGVGVPDDMTIRVTELCPSTEPDHG